MILRMLYAEARAIWLRHKSRNVCPLAPADMLMPILLGLADQRGRK